MCTFHGGVVFYPMNVTPFAFSHTNRRNLAFAFLAIIIKWLQTFVCKVLYSMRFHEGIYRPGTEIAGSYAEFTLKLSESRQTVSRSVVPLASHPAMSEGPEFFRFSPALPITAIPVGVRWHLNVLPTPNSVGRLPIPEPQPGRC